MKNWIYLIQTTSLFKMNKSVSLKTGFHEKVKSTSYWKILTTSYWRHRIMTWSGWSCIYYHRKLNQLKVILDPSPCPEINFDYSMNHTHTGSILEDHIKLTFWSTSYPLLVTQFSINQITKPSEFHEYPDSRTYFLKINLYYQFQKMSDVNICHQPRF